MFRVQKNTQSTKTISHIMIPKTKATFCTFHLGLKHERSAVDLIGPKCLNGRKDVRETPDYKKDQDMDFG